VNRYIVIVRLWLDNVAEAHLNWPRYPNRQRGRSQKPHSVGSNPTRGTCVISHTVNPY
jgi:hypothetical protein